MTDSPNPSHKADDDILTVEEVAEWLHMTPAWVRAHANGRRRPQLPGIKLGKYIRFRRGAVRQTLERWERGDVGDSKRR